MVNFLMLKLNFEFKVFSLVLLLAIPSFLFAQDWSEINGLSANEVVIDIDFANLSDGLVLTRNSNVYVTQDGTNSWDINTPPANVTYQSIEISNSQDVWIMGQEGTLFNGTFGQGLINWNSVNTPTNEYLNGAHFISSFEGWVVGDNETIIFFNPGGVGPVLQNVPGFAGDFNDVIMVGDLGLVVTSQNRVVISRNRGRTWSLGSTLPFNNNIKIEHYNGVFYIFSANGGIMTSIDGIIWNTINVPSSDLADFTLRDGKLYLVGSDGQSWRSDGGGSWIELTGIPDTISLGAITCLANGCFTGGKAGKIYWNCERITLGGRVWGDISGDCVAQGDEQGYFDVQVTTRNSTGTVFQNTYTDENGFYSFQVPEGEYEIVIDPSNFLGLGPLHMTYPCDTATNPNLNIANDQNGTIVNGVVKTKFAVELRCGEELGPFGVVNETVDFGFTYSCNESVNPSSHPVCNVPEFICDFNQIADTCHVMSSDLLFVPNKCGSNDSLSNASWFTFYAGYGNYDFNIDLMGCFPGISGQTGARMGIVTACGDSTDIDCVDLCNGGASGSINSSVLTPGQVYNLFVEGCGGSLCGYTLSVTGNYEPFFIPEPMMISCNEEDCDKVCSNTFVTFEVIDTQSLYESANLSFDWELSYNGFILSSVTTDTNAVDFDLGQSGLYEICLTNVRSECESKDLNFCTIIEAVDIEDEDFGVVELCFFDFILFEGPEYVNNDPTNIADPNGDGIPGWIMPSMVNFISGYNEQTVMHPYGCEYDQYFNLVQLPDSEVANFEIIVCNSSEFPVDLLGQFFTGPVTNQSVTLFGGAANGCDSLNNVTIHHLDYQGDVIQIGCDSNGINLIFDPTIAINSGSFPLDVLWTNSNGNIVPDDGDGDDFTTTVPYGNDVYNISISSNVNNIRTCTYSFSASVNLAQPTIISPDSTCVGDTSGFVFIMPTGVDAANALWNIDGGVFVDQFEVETPVEIYWETPGLKTITLAYIQDGCYVETFARIEVLPKLSTSDIMCTSGQDFVTFSWSNLPFLEVTSVEVITGQTGILSGETYQMDGLNAGENVIVSFNVTSSVCDSYSILSACSTLGCDSISGLPDVLNCEDAADFPLCDITSLGDGCKSFNPVTADMPEIPCAQGTAYSENWIPFTAGEGVYAIEIQLMNCALSDGVQYALLKGCDFTDLVVCNSMCSSDDIIIESALLEPGQKYTIWMNGCNGNICDYAIDVTGSFAPYQLPVPIDVLVNGETLDSVEICEADSMGFEAIFNPGFNFTNGVDFKWQILNIDNGDSLDLTTNTTAWYDIFEAGSYQICLVDLEHSCDSISFDPICVNLFVNKVYENVEVTCEATDTAIVFTWDTDLGHMSYSVEVLTDQTGVLDSNTFTVTGLMPDEEVTIILETSLIDGCDSLLITEQSCIANPCQSVEVLITPVGPLAVCLGSGDIDFNASVNPFTEGIGVFVGNGITDEMEGIFNPDTAGVGSHEVQYIFTGNNGCVSAGTVFIEVLNNVQASFTVNPNAICTDDTVLVKFTGIVNANTAVSWNFEGASEIIGSGTGPYFLIYGNSGFYEVSVLLEDSLCGSESLSDSISVEMCETCICENIIDTTVNCTTIYNPVCGCDGVTYNNACEAQYYAGVPSWSSGPCNNTEMDTIRAVCDDNDPQTVNDVINDNCECVGEMISSTEDVRIKYHIFPNPTNGRMFIHGFEYGRVRVLDILGKVVLDEYFNTNELDLSNFKSGWYWIKTDYGAGRALKI